MKRYVGYIVLALFFFAFYLQDRYALLYKDDWCYAFMVEENYTNFMSVADDGVERHRVTSLHDAMVSQSRDYFKTNGRFILHVMVQYFCGTMTMRQFAVINSIVFALFTLLLIRTINWREGLFSLLAVLSAIWIIFPHKGLTFMGNISLSVNYMWTGAATLLFLLMLESTNRRKYNGLVLALLCLLSIVIGSLQESFSICIAGASVLHLLLHWRTLNRQTIALSIAYIIGAMLCVFSPANFSRVDNNGGFGFNYRLILGLLSSPPFVLLTVTVVIAIVKGRLKEIVDQHFFLIAAIAVNLLFMMVVAYNGRHQLTAVNLLSFVLLFRLFLEYRKIISQQLQRHIRMAWVILMVVAVVSWYPILSSRRAYYDTYMAFIEQVLTSPDGVVSGKEFDEMSCRITHNPLMDCNYIMPFTISDWDYLWCALSVYLTDGESNQLIKEVR